MKCEVVRELNPNQYVILDILDYRIEGDKVIVIELGNR